MNPLSPSPLFPPCEGPRVFALPPGADFAQALIAGLEARLAGRPPEALAEVEIWVNTQRARRTLTARLAQGPARLLPRIRVVTELAVDPLAPVDLPPPVPDLRRRLELARLVARRIEAEPGFAAETAAFELAGSLAELLDAMQGEGVDPAALARVDPAEHAAHWQRSLRFLLLLGDYLAAAGLGDGQGRLRAVAEAWAAEWAERPPPHAVLVAGSTGSRGATRLFMAAVARLPQGALVLPGLDPLPASVWARLGADDPGAAEHPQQGFRRLADALGFDPAAVPAWHPVAPPAPARNALVSLALRPAPVTDQWLSDGAALAGTLASACAVLDWVEAPDPRAEAQAIALVLREAAETGTRAALVTPDRTLARRVTAELGRWGLIPDDSAGRPLALTPPGVLLRRLAALPGTMLTPQDLLVLLKHPLVASAPGARAGHLRLTARLERRHLRGGAPWIDWDTVARWAAAQEDRATPAWAAWLRAALAPLAAAAGRAPLALHVARTRAAAEALAAGPAGAAGHGLWEKEAGRQTLALMQALAAEADAGGPLRPAEYRALLQTLMAARDVPEEAVVTHGRIAIWGTLEARVQSAELVILGALNEGTWPRLPGTDPWLSRGIRRELGLPSPDLAIGLSAHDFQQAMGAGRVVLTRAVRDAEAPTVASRWLLRLENLMLGLGDEGAAALAAARQRGAALIARAALLDRPAAPVPPAPRPAPRPPAAARPAELSVTAIERLISDPYAIYAGKVLGLRRLDPPGREADALARGSAIHKALDAFVAVTADDLPPDARALFAETMRNVLADAAPWPAVRAVWTARLGRAAGWFLGGEAERRARARPFAREVRGQRPLDGLALPFVVTARADRLDRAEGGGYAIYDYKSGGIPSRPEAHAFHLQLPLEGAIAAAGGFEGAPAGPALHLELLGLGPRKAVAYDDPAGTAAEAWARLAELIAHYQRPENGYVARLRPSLLKYAGDFDHLARLGEWADGDPPDPGGRAVTPATAAQVRASTPAASSWVSANAGSGKTRVLIDRVARLLLAGTDPARILCLTYTKAAAAEMQTRLFRTLGRWAMLGDAALRGALAELGEPGAALPAERLARARTLFAGALETPGGLRIQTIHAFCEALLRRFPLEAGVAPGFTVIEQRQARALREELLDALADAHPELIAVLADHLSVEADALLQEIAHHRAAFAGPFEPACLAAALGVDPALTPEALAATVLPAADEAMLGTIVALCAASGPQDRACAEALAAALATTDPETRLLALESALLTRSGATPFTAKIGTFPAKALRAAHPALTARLEALMARVEAARRRRLALRAFERSCALNHFARAWIAAFEAKKRTLGLVDFDDMIDRAQALLTAPGTAAWVLWRLDGGIDHLLVDEAQDTSPAQWRVIEAISAEFFAGLGARAAERTIFVVGDEKQSIYSFQGADPAAFGDMREHYERVIAGLGAELQRCDLLYSFRSARPILDLVDAVFRGAAGADLAPGITHHAIDEGRPGRVELWPFLPKSDKAPESPWYAPLETPAPGDPVAALATRIAARIAEWLREGRELPGWDRAVRAGDVMILVQRRARLFYAIIRALRVAGVPVAGADVLAIDTDELVVDQLVVWDLLAALRVAATPRDDLSLAALLRSPLGGLNEDELFALAHGRRGSLWAELRALPEERAPAVRRMLEELMAQADYLRPYELLQRILIRHDGRRRLVARLGTEAADGIDALLDQALAYERVEAPSLTGFLAWIDRDTVEVKRRIEEGADQVRVMTVHGAKGLEAPIVILPDTGRRPEGVNPPQILPLAPGLAAWRTKNEDAPPALAAAEAARRALQRAENMRLLYVAMTRARSWLIVCGAGLEPKRPEDGWHGLVEQALRGLGPTAEPGDDGATLALSWNWHARPAPAPPAPPAPAALPAWATRPAGQPPAPAAPRAPSALGGAHVLLMGAALAEDEAAARARGEAIHRLLETLHARPPSDWPRLAERILAGNAGAEALLAEAAAVLGAPELAALFGPGSRAEVEVTAALPALGGARILGRVDRLVVAPDRVLAVDFKSNRAVPDHPEAVPEGILRQMGAYAAALGAIWPARAVETAIVWTRAPRLMPLPGPLVAAALARAAGHLDPPGARP